MYFKIINGKWQKAEIYNLEKSRQINLYDFCRKTNTMIFCGIGAVYGLIFVFIDLKF
jgi:hypothetical protein